MAIVKMDKISVIGLSNESATVLSALQKIGRVEITTPTENELKFTENSVAIAEIEAQKTEERRRAQVGTIDFTQQDESRIIGSEAIDSEAIDSDIMTGGLEMETYKLSKNGIEMVVTNLGCAIISLEIPAKGGKLDVVLGLDNAQDYAAKKHPFFGVAVGRVANRIGDGKFELSGNAYQLETNDGPHHLHGGSNGFDKKVWDVESATDDKIVFVLESPDGDAGYPGNLTARITYTITDANALRIDYEAATDTETICNLTNHSYFNLFGHDANNVYDHELEIYSDEITAVDAGLIPTGGYVDVAGTPFDFRKVKTIGQDLQAAGDVNGTGGYDHNYVLRGPGIAASVYAPETGIRMTVSTNSPGMQLYTGNFIDGTGKGKGVTYQQHSGFCLETQLFPNAINIPSFQSCVVTKDAPQKFYTEFKFEW